MLAYGAFFCFHVLKISVYESEFYNTPCPKKKMLILYLWGRAQAVSGWQMYFER